ncbi:MAG: phosphodiester glycosidase family protein, partial [Clostridia bacterium]|nr:phosphodiester glycosidase family protein [Clostridia bacterium]
MASICPYHHIGAAYGSSTLAQVVENLLDYGCVIAYNLDGGRSSMMVFMGNTINRSSFSNGGWRGLRDMVGYLTSDLVPGP